MARNIKTDIYCYDDYRGFTEEVKKQFPDTARYNVLSFQTTDDFIASMSKQKENKSCKVAILGFHDSKEQFEMLDHLVQEIKGINPHTGVILLGPMDKLEEVKKIVRFNIDAYVPKNTNSILRVHNTVKKLISQHGIAIYKRKSNFSTYALITFLLLSAAFLVFAYFRLPEYF